MIDAYTVEAQTERTSGLIIATLTDELGAAVTLASITSLTMTLNDQKTGQVINSRRNQNILNLNNVTVGATNGQVAWSVQVLDTTPTQRTGQIVHVATFVVAFGVGKGKTWQVLIPITIVTPP